MCTVLRVLKLLLNPSTVINSPRSFALLAAATVVAVSVYCPVLDGRHDEIICDLPFPRFWVYFWEMTTRKLGLKRRVRLLVRKQLATLAKGVEPDRTVLVDESKEQAKVADEDRSVLLVAS